MLSFLLSCESRTHFSSNQTHLESNHSWCDQSLKYRTSDNQHHRRGAGARTNFALWRCVDILADPAHTRTHTHTNGGSHMCTKADMRSLTKKCTTTHAHDGLRECVCNTWWGCGAGCLTFRVRPQDTRDHKLRDWFNVFVLHQVNATILRPQAIGYVFTKYKQDGGGHISVVL